MTDLKNWIDKNDIKEYIIDILNIMKKESKIEIDDYYDEDENSYIQAYIELLQIKTFYENETRNKVVDMYCEFIAACELSLDEYDLCIY